MEYTLGYSIFPPISGFLTKLLPTVKPLQTNMQINCKTVKKGTHKRMKVECDDFVLYPTMYRERKVKQRARRRPGSALHISWVWGPAIGKDIPTAIPTFKILV